MAEDFDLGGPLPEESSNRTFLMAAGGLGGLLILSMICLAVYALVLAPAQRESRATEVVEINLQNTRDVQTQTAEAQERTPSRTPTEMETPLPTGTVEPTQVIVLPTYTPTPFLTLPTLAPETATAAAKQTLEAIQGGGGEATPTATALPATGFADEVGIPGLVIMGGILLAVIFIARSLRTRSSA